MNELLKNPVIQVNGTATIGPNVESANLCEIKDSRVVTTSLRVAEIFGKQHKHVLEAIRNIECSDGFRGSNFRLIQRISDLGQGRTRKDPCYLITRDGFTFLVMGFTGKTAAKFKEAYIRAFNEMEAKLRRRQEAEQLPQPSKPHYTMADMPRMVHERLQRPDADVIVESYGQLFFFFFLMESGRNVWPVQKNVVYLQCSMDGGSIHFAEQAVKLLTSKVGFLLPN